MRSNTCIAASAAVLGLLFLSACGGGGSGSGSGGGGGGSGVSDAERERLRSDARIVRLGEIEDRADNLVVASTYVEYSQSIGGQTTRDREVERFTCTGSRCAGDRGADEDVQQLPTVDDALDPRSGIALTRFTLDSRRDIGDFNTWIATAQVDAESEVPGFTDTDFPPVSSYGLWRQHGWAAVEIADGPWAGTEQGDPSTGNYRSAVAYVAGEASGSNPTGMGSATWTGIAEAASTETFRRHQGTATLTIADLSRPSVDVDILIAGSSIAAPAWSGMALADGRYASGTAGTDRIQGDFYGPDHGETYGIFDTDAYVGAFGARRDP